MLSLCVLLKFPFKRKLTLLGIFAVPMYYLLLLIIKPIIDFIEVFNIGFNPDMEDGIKKNED